MIRQNSRMRPGLLALALVSGLSACASGNHGDVGAMKVVTAVIKEQVAARKTKPAVPQLTRAQVDASPIPLLIMQVEKDRRAGVFGQINANSGAQTFASLDAVSLTLRDGVLISTRGLGTDLMSAEVPTAATIASGDASYQRSYQVLDGTDQTLDLQYECHLRPEGQETLVIAERSYPTRTITEVCIGDGDVFENQYWIDNRGKIRQSRQWTGTVIGKLRMTNPAN